MAAAGYHVRSTSLPAKPHPLSAALQDQLNFLKASESSPLATRLGSLKTIYELLDDLLRSQSTRQALFSERQSQAVEQALNGSLRMLELCSNVRDFLSKMKEIVQELASALRRRRKRCSTVVLPAGESAVRDAAEAYLTSRKRLTKLVRKFIRFSFQEKNGGIAPDAAGSDSSSVVTMLRGVEEINLEVFQAILCYISQQGRLQPVSGWSMWIVVLLQSKPCGHSECQDDGNEMKKVDSEVLAFRSSKDLSFSQAQVVLKGLERVESSMKEIEEEMECIYRRQVKARVSLLNCLSRC
ncbi:unnamed protein product [Linum trigynum]|uniref:Uncharacterized protein n=1 Tax=Linum trigynum TaxID=586398 RepID=A0AAV2E431_9ROSI